MQLREQLHDALPLQVPAPQISRAVVSDRVDPRGRHFLKGSTYCLSAGQPWCNQGQLLSNESIFIIAYVLLRELGRIHATGALHGDIKPGHGPNGPNGPTRPPPSCTEGDPRGQVLAEGYDARTRRDQAGDAQARGSAASSPPARSPRPAV